MGIRKMSKTSLYISFAILLTLCVVNLNANPKPKADDGIDIIINRVGPRMGPRIMGLRKPAWKKAQWAPMPQNLGPESTEAEIPAEDYPGYRSGGGVLPYSYRSGGGVLPYSYRSGVLPAAKPADKPKKIYRSAVLPAAKPAAKPEKTYRSAVLPAAKTAAKPAAKPKTLMQGARWIPVVPPNYEIHSNAYNGDWDNYYY